MLTRLRVQGFKSLLDVEVLFGPFTCFIGPNAAGKSNIFDAIRFLSLLANNPIMQAVAQIRESSGRALDPRRLFTLFGGFIAPTLHIEADMIVERRVEDDFGVEAEATTSLLRYKVEFRMENGESPERLQLVEECLEPILGRNAFSGYPFAAARAFREAYLRRGTRTRPYISFEKDSGEIGLHQDKRHGRLMKIPGRKASRTALSGVNTSEYPTVLAAKKELLSWQTFMLEPSAMRAPSAYRDPDRIDSYGRNLPAALYRLQRQENTRGQVCASLANRLSRLVDDIHEIRVLDDERTETFTLEAMDAGNVYHPARSLSDGTLRFLALSILSMDPLAQGLMCLEEPENGIHPQRVAQMVELLRDIAIDPESPPGSDNPLRQVAVNTHSPEVLQACSQDEVIYVGTEEVDRDGSAGHVTNTRLPERTWRQQLQTMDQLMLTLGQLEPYMREGALSQEWQQMLLPLDSE